MLAISYAQHKFWTSSTQNQIQRDGAFKFYSYKSTVCSFAPQNPAPHDIAFKHSHCHPSF